MAEIVNRLEESTTLVKLISSDGEGFEVPIEIAKVSVFVSTMIPTDENEEMNIPLPNVKAVILSKVIEFLHHFKIEAMNAIAKVFDT
jgi:S-phase kinase-associated protein 1